MQEAPLEQTFQTKPSTSLSQIINLISAQKQTLFSKLTRFVPAWHFSCHLDLMQLRVSHPFAGKYYKPHQGFPYEFRRSSLTSPYNLSVARGWESKSVEEQQAQAVSTPSPVGSPLTPDQIASQRRRQGLMLSRQHVLQQLEAAQSPRHRELLQRALADLDAQLAQLG
jgi:hypothetical protein